MIDFVVLERQTLADPSCSGACAGVLRVCAVFPACLLMTGTSTPPTPSQMQSSVPDILIRKMVR